MTLPSSTAIHSRYWNAALAVSLALNCVLLWHIRARHVSATPGHPAEELIAERNKSAEVLPTARAAVTQRFDWGNLSTLDFRSLRSRLLEGGCPEHTVEVILETAIDQAYRPRLVHLFGRTRSNFWDQAAIVKTRRKLPETPEQKEAERAFAALLEERDGLMKELVRSAWNRNQSRSQGPDDGDARLNFLSEEKRQRISEQQRIISELRQTLRQQGTAEAEVNREIKAVQAQHEAERSLLLSPEEVEEYRLRFSRFNYVVQNLYSFEPSRGERQAIIHLHESYDGKAPDAELEKALGRERFIQFQRARDSSYESIYKVGSYLKLPEEQIIRVFELKNVVEKQTQTIRDRQDLDKKQRTEVLRSLKKETLTRLGEEFGPEGRALYLENGGWWINALAESAE